MLFEANSYLDIQHKTLDVQLSHYNVPGSEKTNNSENLLWLLGGSAALWL